MLCGQVAVVLPESEAAVAALAEKSGLALRNRTAAAGTFPDYRTTGREQHLRTAHRLIVAHQLGNHAADLLHKRLRGELATLDLLQHVLPFRSQKRRLELFRKYRNQGDTDVLGNQADRLFVFLSLHKTGGNQLLQNPGAGGGCAQPLALGIIRHLFRPGIFHGGKQRILGVSGRRLCLSFLQRNSKTVNGLSFRHRREYPFLLFARRIAFPAGVQHRFSLCGEYLPAAFNSCYRFQIGIRRTDRHQHLTGNQLQHLALSGCQRRQFSFSGSHRGNDGMVIGNLTAVADLL